MLHLRILSSHISRYTTVRHYHKLTSAQDALIRAGLKSGSTILVGGFGLAGIPLTLIKAIASTSHKNLTCVSDSCGTTSNGLGILLQSSQISKMVSSYMGDNKLFQKQYLSGDLTVEFCPQGSLAEKLRVGGSGIPAFYTATGVGTIVEHGGFPMKYKKGTDIPEIVSLPKPAREFKSKFGEMRKYLQEEAIHGDIAIVKAWKSDRFGNLVFHHAQNFNPDCAKAAKFAIAQVEHVVELGEIAPDEVQLSGIFIDAIVLADDQKFLEHGQPEPMQPTLDSYSKIRHAIAKRASLEIKEGMVVNLGIGIPTLCADYLEKQSDIMIHSENGILGMGPMSIQNIDPDLINAGKDPVSLVPGSSIFCSSESFSMIRGAHLDLTILGSLQVDEMGDIANWIVPGAMVKGMGGAMDLVASGVRVVAVMPHLTKKGGLKVLKKCTIPITGKRCVSRIITELAVFDVDHDGLILIEKSKTITMEDLRRVTEAKFRVSENLIQIMGE